MPETEAEAASEEGDQQPSLLPAGPLARLHIVPEHSRLARLGAMTLRAQARDAEGVRIERVLEIEWSIAPALAHLENVSGRSARIRAGEEVGPAAVRALAREGGVEVVAEADVEIVDQIEAAGTRAGIPEPVFLNEPYASWRSRMQSGRWEVNSGHPDYGTASETARRRLRYLAALLAKEVVLHSFPMPQLGSTLERLVSVLTLAERRLERG